MATKNNAPGSADFDTQISSIASDDIVIFSDGSDTVTTNLDQSAVDLQELIFTPECFLNIGSAGTSLQIEVSNVSTSSDPHLYYAGSGKYVYIDSATAGVDRLELVRTGGGTFYATGGPWPDVEMRGGICNFNDQTTLTTWSQSGGHATIDTHSSDTITTATVVGTGQMVLGRAGTTLNVGGNAVVVKDDQGGAYTTVNVYGNAKLQWGSGAITTLNDYTGDGGGVDLMHADTELTITNYNAYHDRPVVYNKSLVTITNMNRMVGTGII